MPADGTQHQHFVRLSAAVSADRTQLNRRTYFVLWFFNRLQLPGWRISNTGTAASRLTLAGILLDTLYDFKRTSKTTQKNS